MLDSPAQDIASTTLLKRTLPFRRSPRDVAQDILAGGFARILDLAPPRGDLALEQMRRFGIQDPVRARHRLHQVSCRELLRILTWRYPRLDQSSLDDHRIEGPVLYLSYHFGNWEWLGGIFHTLHGDFRPVTRGIRSPFAHRLAQGLRKRVGMNSLIDHAGLRGGRRALQDGAFLAFLADQTPPGASRPGRCLGEDLPVSPLPEWWARDQEFRWLTGTLTSQGSSNYELLIEEFPASSIAQWDRILDAYMTPQLLQSPQHYFGWWHHRLQARKVSRET